MNYVVGTDPAAPHYERQPQKPGPKLSQPSPVTMFESKVDQLKEVVRQRSAIAPPKLHAAPRTAAPAEPVIKPVVAKAVAAPEKRTPSPHTSPVRTAPKETSARKPISPLTKSPKKVVVVESTHQIRTPSRALERRQDNILCAIMALLHELDEEGLHMVR